MYSVYQPWDPLKVCIVGKSYPPEFYNFITNIRVRKVLERIAQETEEDYQKLITLLESFGVTVMRPDINPDREFYTRNGQIAPPPMTPCDWSVMIGEIFYHNWCTPMHVYRDIAADNWPAIRTEEEYEKIPLYMKQEVDEISKTGMVLNSLDYKTVLTNIRHQGNSIISNLWPNCGNALNRAQVSRIGRDLYIGTENYKSDTQELKKKFSEHFPEYRCHVINTGGHGDGTYCPVKPGLIISLRDIPTYAETFPGWEVVYLPGQSWAKVKPFLQLKEKNHGKWWVPGEELNDDFTEYVESWLSHWVGYVEETVFDVNMLVIDEKNVVCNNYNQEVFAAFERHGVTPHVVNFRHRYFWDGGLHCITSDVHREGTVKDYFPERG
jgi:N-dimethylarginine dimethylaminohydrolase